MKKRAVALVVLTDIPEIGCVAVLQKRGEFNHEKMRSESYPGGCQLTVHGGLKPDESVVEGLLRESHEEMGHDFEQMLSRLIGNPDVFEVVMENTILNGVALVNHAEDESSEIFNFAVRLPYRFLNDVRLGPSSGGICLVRQEDVKGIVDLRSFNKVEGVNSRSIVAMFPDAKKAVQKAFEVLK